MKNITTSIVFLLLLNSVTYAADQVDRTSLPFRSGSILAAEIQDNSPEIIKISEYEPPSTITENVGYAAVVVQLDKNRTIGIYDYVLKNKSGKVFPCVVLREENGAYDAEVWRMEKTDPLKKYTMVFKVEKPSLGKSEYSLHFNLHIGKTEDIPLEFNSVKSYTIPGSIPAKGIYGKPQTPQQQKSSPHKKTPVKTVTKPKKDTTAEQPVKTSKPSRNISQSIMDSMAGGSTSSKSAKSKKTTKESTPAKSGNGIIKISAGNYGSSSVYKKYKTNNAFDGKLKTKWRSEKKDNQSIWCKVGDQPVKVSEIKIIWSKYYPREFKVSTQTKPGDNAAKTVIQTITAGKGKTQTIKIGADVCIIIIHDMKKNSMKGKSFEISEFEVYGE